MKLRAVSVQNRPKDNVIAATVYGFLTGTTLVGGVVFAIAADQVRKYRNTRRLTKEATR